MNREQILALFRSLAMSQGFYGRLLRDLTPEALDYLVSKNFKTELDLILFIENGEDPDEE